MRLGIIKISDEILLTGHEFPKEWKIIDIWKPEDRKYVEALMSGPEFPEVKGNDSYKHFKVLVHIDYVDFDDDHPVPEKRIVYRHEVFPEEAVDA